MLAPRTYLIVALASAFVGGFALLAAMGIGPRSSAENPPETPLQPSPSPVPLGMSESGRLIFPILIDGLRMDEKGQPILGEDVFITQTCEADALANIKDGRVTDIKAEGTAASVTVGEGLKGLTRHEGDFPVYRDENGDLRFGCDPDSVVIINIEGITPHSSAENPPETPLQPDPSPAPIDLAESGRLIFHVLTDAIRVDESGRAIPGSGYAITQTCEADALAVTIDGRVTEVQARGTAASVAVGERLKGPAPHQGLMEVYRDENGDLRQGCDPGSWTIIRIE